MKEIDLAFVAQLAAGIGVFVALILAYYELLPWLRRVMSRRAERMAEAESVESVVYRPVGATSLDGQTSAPAASGMEVLAPDIDATNWQLPPVSRYLSDDALIVLLATQKLPNGKYRSSANKIVAYLGGDRNHILKLVREVREGVPVYRQYTEEERAVLQPNGHE